MSAVHLTTEDMDPIIKRLKRARGQLDGVLRMIDDERECGDVVTQLAAVSKAVDRAGFAMIAAGLEQCLKQGENSEAARERLQKMFMSLA